MHCLRYKSNISRGLIIDPRVQLSYMVNLRGVLLQFAAHLEQLYSSLHNFLFKCKVPHDLLVIVGQVRLDVPVFEAKPEANFQSVLS
jgi:hypothetical protein